MVKPTSILHIDIHLLNTNKSVWKTKRWKKKQKKSKKKRQEPMLSTLSIIVFLLLFSSSSFSFVLLIFHFTSVSILFQKKHTLLYQLLVVVSVATLHIGFIGRLYAFSRLFFIYIQFFVVVVPPFYLVFFFSVSRLLSSS